MDSFTYVQIPLVVLLMVIIAFSKGTQGTCLCEMVSKETELPLGNRLRNRGIFWQNACEATIDPTQYRRRFTDSDTNEPHTCCCQAIWKYQEHRSGRYFIPNVIDCLVINCPSF